MSKTLPTIKLPRSNNWLREENGNNPCVICNRHVKKTRFMLHIVDGGGSVFDPNEEYEDESSDLLWLPIGSDCLRRHPELKPYVMDVTPT